MINQTALDGDMNTMKLTMLMDEDCVIKIRFPDNEDVDLIYLVFESMEERFVTPLFVAEDYKEEAAEILTTAFTKIGELAPEEGT